MSFTKILVTKNDGYFDDLVVYLFAFQSFVHATEIYNSGSALAWPDDDFALIDAKQASMRLMWAPAKLLRAVCSNQFPTTIELSETPQSLSGAGGLNLGAIDPLLFSFAQALITNYFERHLDEIERLYGKEKGAWPDVWNFGRVIRNAMSHGGSIHFKNKQAAPVKWRGLVYSPFDEGKVILHTDIWSGDLYYLLRDLDDVRRFPKIK